MIILKITPGLPIKPRLLAALACFILESSQAQPITPTATNEPKTVIAPSLAGDSIVLPTGFNDPIEPFNRAMWGFNKGFATWVVRPASKTYRRVVFKPVRTGIGNMGKNLTFPGKLLNNMLQESGRGWAKKQSAVFVTQCSALAASSISRRDGVSRGAMPVLVRLSPNGAGNLDLI